MGAKIGIEDRGGWLRLRLPQTVAAGAKRYISTGLAATEENHRRLQTIAWDMEADLLVGNFDPTLERYRKLFTLPKVDRARPLTLLSLWDEFSEFKRPQLAVTTYHKDFRRTYRNAIASLPTQDINQAAAIRQYLLENKSALATKELLTQINACCKWALSAGKIAANPFVGMAAEIKVIVPNEGEIDPFSREERDAILNGFERSQPWKYYYPFVWFLFATGCRTGEAVALCWRHIARDCSVITFAESYDPVLKIYKDTKTHKTRRFPCNESLRTFLEDRRSLNPSPDTPVFQAKQGGVVRHHDFSNRAWKGIRCGEKRYIGVVSILVETGEIERYRPPYNTRHTAITNWVDKGVPIPTIAKWVGNSPEVIFKHYAGWNPDLIPPEFL
jgi:integrase